METGAPVNDVVCLAFGCFHFPPRLEKGDRLKGSDYFSALTRALEESAGIDRVELRVDNDDLAWELEEAPGAPPTLQEHGSPFPHPGYMDLSFKVRIPERIQAELMGESELALYGVQSEDFRVALRYGYEMPVVAVQTLGVDEDSNPSRSVILVREFLSREVARSTQESVSFDSLGPSPAHSDFYLLPQERPPDESGRYWRVGYACPAYHHYRYGFDPSDFPSAWSVADDFLFEATVEMSLFYKLAQEEFIRGDLWRRLARSVQQLVALQRSRGPAGMFKRTFLSSRRLGEAQLDLIEFGSRQVSMGGHLAREIAKLYREPGHRLAKELVEEAHSDQSEYPSKEIAELLKMLEHRRLTDRDMLMLGLASILGGALGAVGGLLAG